MSDREPSAQPGPPVRWETVTRSWDADDRLFTERVITTKDTVINPGEPERKTGMYL